ncbi:Lysine histidine transporter-like 7 [Linum perenne]
MAEVYPIDDQDPPVTFHSFSSGPDCSVFGGPEQSTHPEEDDDQSPHVIAIDDEEQSITNHEEGNPDVESWLPITESRNGSLWSSVFHLLSSGIGVQALLLPVAFASLGWAWGIVTLSMAFIWQLYTIWVLVQLHEPVNGTRYSRFLQLAMAAFGPKLGKILAIFPVMYLSGGSCVVLIINGSGAMKLFFKELSPSSSSLTGVEWFLVFTTMAILMATQRPNLHSISGLSLVAAITGIAYCTLMWAIPVAHGRIDDTEGSGLKERSGMGRMSEIMNGIGIIMLSFRGHNLILEIQGTLPSGPKEGPSKKKMWRAVIISYAIVMACLFPLAIAGFWAYGNKVPSNGGLLKAFTTFHHPNTSKPLKAIIYFLILLNCLTSFQIYAMPVFDNLELRFVAIKNKPCPKWVRVSLRLFFGGLTFFVAVAFPFLPSLAPLIGGIALPLTFAYPCLMWIAMKKKKGSLVWGFNLVVGGLGMGLCVLLVVGAIWNLATKGLHANFFRP